MKSPRPSRFTHHVSHCLLVFVVAVILLISHASAQAVEIPDPNLLRAVREALDLPDEAAITQQEMLRLEKLTAKEAQIENITGLEYAINLKSLVLTGNNIQDITPLAKLIKLESLTLRKNPIADLSPLANLTELTALNLSRVIIKDLTPLSNLMQLRELHLIHCQITDITPLANLTQLVRLNLRDNQIVDVGPLANLTQLTDLTIANNPITDFRPLFGLNLQSVDVDIHKSQELASTDVEIPDPNLGRAVRKELGMPAEVPLTQLVMSQLTSLNAIASQIADLTGLEHATHLKKLVLPINQIQDITPLTNLVNLDSVVLRKNPIADLSPLANLTNLTHLNLNGVIITDLTPLSNLTQLRELHATSCQITDITPLANLTQLVYLNLGANLIVDVTPLTNLTQLKTLWISRNRILDFSPLQGLSLTDFRYDEECLLPDFPIQDRIQNRSLPSTVGAWGAEPVNKLHLSREERISYHDIFWTGRPFRLRFESTPQGYQRKGDIPLAIAKREELISRNPNMLFLAEIRQRDAKVNHHYPEDWPYWLRDNEGNPVQNHRHPDVYLIDMTLIEVQDIIVEQAIAVAGCGLFDGIFFDWWREEGGNLRDFSVTPAPFLRPPEAEREARLSILQRIRENVPDDFLIVCNLGDRSRPIAAPHINGSFMETGPDDPERGYTRDEIIEIETTLIWREENLREPQINCLQGEGIPSEPHESPTNKRIMRLFTTMSLTLSDGYIHFVNGIPGQQVHFRYRFLDANLGQPIGPTAKRYQDVEGLYLREFTNGWAVYNRSGQAQEVSLPQSVTGVASGQTNTTHLLPDLDGEIYLKTSSLADVNADGKVNILDLVQVANDLGKSAPDPNGDGTVNILDLVFVAQQFSQ